MMKKIDEKNHFAEKMVEHVAAMGDLAKSQEKLAAAMERLTRSIQDMADR